MEIITRQEFASAIKLNDIKMNALASPLMKMMKIDELNKLYTSVHSKTGLEFIDSVLEELGIKIEVDADELKNIPLEGGFIALANHPYGGIDGLIMLKLMASVRPDFKLIANFILKKISNIENFLIPVNPFENLRSDRTNVGGLKQTINFMEQGFPIGIFPAGEVSAFQSNNNKIVDKEWHTVVGRLVTKAQVPVLPVYFHGSNSYIFNLLGLIHPGMRTAKLPSELFNKKGTTIKVRIGKPIAYKDIKLIGDNAQLLRFLRAKTYALGSALQVERFFSPPLILNRKTEPVVAELPLHLIEKDIDSLRAENLLFSQNNFEVFVANATRIPHVLQEIGRLREITFRAVGEGTNTKIDIDEFDLYYHHLFLWDKDAKKIAGSYRIGKGKDIYDKYRKKGFYIHSLFKIRNEMIPILEQSLELGRSFVCAEYQQKPLSLFTLWKGILAFLNNNPEYRYLIGPVSISNNFSKTSKQLMIKFIEQNYYNNELAAYVQARKMFKPNELLDAEALINATQNNIRSVDDLIAEIEPDHARMPVLLKKYIKQNGKIIGFNIDPKFSNALDGFLIVDALDLPKDTLSKLAN